jgi:2-polyprenyl-6-methoxyphenol hydroxylase-like FAD-dependent oxidoreductase
MATSRTGACIVRGGPAGLPLGLLLAKRGAPVIVLEGHENFDREFRARSSSRARPTSWTSWASSGTPPTR